MQFDIITIFPNIFNSYFNESILKRAQKKKKIKITIHDLRDYAADKRKTVDDKPYGGGVGMVMKVEPVYKVLREIKKLSQPKVGPRQRQAQQPLAGNKKIKKSRTILFTPAGKTFNQKMAKRLAKYNRLIVVCPRYEGHDARIEKLVDEKISIGNYILTGGEIPAMIIIDAVSRLIPGVLGKDESNKDESFSQEGYFEYPHYTRPGEFQGMKVPKVLLSGNHKKIEEWRNKHSNMSTGNRNVIL